MNSPSAHSAHPANCHNCGHAVSLEFCPACGQETKLHVASAGEFLHEFVGHYVALEGKLWKSLLLLLGRPGFLTAEYIAGRRVRYVQPLRLYLSFSILFFALVKFGGFELANFDSSAAGQATPNAAIVIDLAATDQAATLDPAIASLLNRVNPAWSAKFATFMHKTPAEQSKLFTAVFFSYVPYAIFCLMPLFAVFLKLLYLRSGRYYGEHLLFALHANAFAFVLLGFTLMMPWGFGKFLLMAWLLVYLPLAMQRVYGGKPVLTALRWVVLALLHVASICLAILFAFSLAVIA